MHGGADYMECYTYLRNIQDLLCDGKTPYESRSATAICDHPISAKDISRLHQCGPKVLPGKVLGYVL